MKDGPFLTSPYAQGCPPREDGVDAFLDWCDAQDTRKLWHIAHPDKKGLPVMPDNEDVVRVVGDVARVVVDELLRRIAVEARQACVCPPSFLPGHSTLCPQYRRPDGPGLVTSNPDDHGVRRPAG